MPSNNDLYEMRKALREQARQTEREYTRQATRVALDPLYSIGEDAVEAGQKMRKGGRQLGQAAYEATTGDYKEAAINAGSGALNAAAGVVNAAVSPITGAIRSVTPDLGLFEAAINAAANTGLGQKAIELSQANPRATEALLNIADIMAIRGSGQLLGRGFNALAENSPTKMEGFYKSPSPVSKAVAVAKASGPQVFNAINQMYNPMAGATRRVIGTGKGRRDEYVTRAAEGAKGFNEARGNMMASPFMDTQAKQRTTPDPATVVANTAEMKRYVQHFGDMADKPTVRANITSNVDVPDKVADAAMEHLYAVHKTDTSPGGTSLVVRKPKTGEGLDAEATGGRSSAASVSALSSQNTLDAARKAMPDADTKDFYTEYVTIAKYANSDNIRMAVRQERLPASFVTKTGVQKTELMQSYWSAFKRRSEGKKLNEKQKQVYDFFQSAPRARLRDRGDGIYSFSDSHKSTAQDLGGVNDWVAIDTNNNKVYTMISDGHDMFGMNPSGGNSLINTTPIYSFDIGQKTKFEKGGKNPDVSVSEIEEITGMKRRKGESTTAYQARVLRDYKAPVTAEDLAKSAENFAATGMLISQTQEDEDEEG